jgi:hypothetical protein
MKQETKQVIINATMALLLVSMIAGVRFPETPIVHAQNNEVVATASPKALETTTEVQNDTPESYIKEVFGEHADKAFLLLKGNGEKGSCAENRQLNPKAVNDNRTWGGVGRDVNIFQVNDVYHPVVELNLENDWKANIDYAKRMFDHDGETFSKRWTCGKYYAKLGYSI